MTCPLHINCPSPCSIEYEVRAEMRARIRGRFNKHQIAGRKARKVKGARLPWDTKPALKSSTSPSKQRVSFTAVDGIPLE